jgi:branched-chain amino acid transport system substrate-binding protein
MLHVFLWKEKGVMVHPKLGNSKFLSIILGIVMVLGGLSACASNGSNNTNTTQGSGPVKVGISLSLTGDNSADGQNTLQGYQLWQTFVNKNGGLLGRQVQLIYYNDASNTAQTRTNYEKLISVDHVNFVLGPFAEDFTVTGAEVAARHGYTFVEGIGTAPSTFAHHLKNLFAVSLPAISYMNSFVNYILSLPAGIRPKTIAYATSDDPFTQPQIDAARPKFEAGGLTTAYYSVFPAETTDYNPIAQRVVASKPDVVVLGTVGLQDYMGFMQYFKQQHFNPKVIIATAGPDAGAQFVNAIGNKNTEGLLVPNDGWFPTVKSYQNDQFVPDFLAKFGGNAADIPSDAVQAFSTGQVLTQAVVQANSLDNGTLMTVLRNGTFQSLQGPVRFGQDGENVLAVPFLFQWQNQQLIPVYPQEQAQANLEYPKPAWQ